MGGIIIWNAQVGDLYQRRTPERLAEYLGSQGGAGGGGPPGRVIPDYSPPDTLCTAYKSTAPAALLTQALSATNQPVESMDVAHGLLSNVY